MEKGIEPVLPIPPLELSDNDVVPVQGLSYLGERHSGGGQTPRMLFILSDFYEH